MSQTRYHGIEPHREGRYTKVIPEFVTKWDARKDEVRAKLERNHPSYPDGKVAYPTATTEYTAHVIDGDYIVAFKRGHFTDNYFMHPALCEESERCSVEHGTIQRGEWQDRIAEALETQGASDQVYGDGYEAMNALRYITL